MFRICESSKLYFFHNWITCFWKWWTSSSFESFCAILEQVRIHNTYWFIERLHQRTYATKFVDLNGIKFGSLIIFRSLMQIFVWVIINSLCRGTYIQPASFSSSAGSDGLCPRADFITFGIFAISSFSILTLVFNWVWNDRASTELFNCSSKSMT